jgi:hypothetical protein
MAWVAGHWPMFFFSCSRILARVSLTVKPLSASFTDGAITVDSGREPHFFNACSMPATVPGTPTA